MLDRLKSLFRKPDATRVAVLIPVYNVTAFLEETLRSVATQDYPHKEIIVVDDGSTPNAAQEIRRICSLFDNTTLLRQEHAGAAAARTKAVLHTSAEYVLFLDGDDLLHPGALKHLMDALHKNPQAIAAYARVNFINIRGKLIAERHFPGSSGTQLLHDLLARRPCMCNGSICIRTNTLKKLIVDNHSIPYAEDWMLWCHLALSGTIIAAGNRFVLSYREHDDNVSLTFPGYYPEIITTLDRVYRHPAFITAVGEEKLCHLREVGICRLHMQLARYYAKMSDPQKAAYHLNKITMLPEALPEFISAAHAER